MAKKQVRNTRKKKAPAKKQQKGGIFPFLIPLIAAGIGAASTVGGSIAGAVEGNKNRYAQQQAQKRQIAHERWLASQRKK